MFFLLVEMLIKDDHHITIFLLCLGNKTVGIVMVKVMVMQTDCAYEAAFETMTSGH